MRRLVGNRRSRRRGFTLIEVLLVLVILGVIAAMVVPRLLGTQVDSMKKATEASIRGLESTLEVYATAHAANYPETLDDLLQPVDLDGNPMQPYVSTFPKDAWGEPFNYEVTVEQDLGNAQVARIWSNGPDRQNDDGDNDDINNWDKLED